MLYGHHFHNAFSDLCSITQHAKKTAQHKTERFNRTFFFLLTLLLQRNVLLSLSRHFARATHIIDIAPCVLGVVCCSSYPPTNLAPHLLCINVCVGYAKRCTQIIQHYTHKAVTISHSRTTHHQDQEIYLCFSIIFSPNERHNIVDPFFGGEWKRRIVAECALQHNI